jgi:fucose permease
LQDWVVKRFIYGHMPVWKSKSVNVFSYCLGLSCPIYLLRMTIVLLIIIYLIFISLGLPDSVLGSTFPAIAENLETSPDMAGYIGFVVSGCTIISSLLSEKLIRKFTTKFVVSFSILLTALGLLCFHLVTKDYVWAFFPIAVLLGLGAGAIDSALNNYVALHYKAIHMNWLHCSWGIGASLSPIIIAPFIDSSNQSIGWNKGILLIAIIQFSIALIAFISLPLWNKVEKISKLQVNEEGKTDSKPASRRTLFRNPIFYLAMLGFFCYCALETTTGNWAGFFFQYGKGFNTQEAARLDSMFYIGITAGRFVCGPVSLKVKEKNMMRIGESILLCGAILAILPFSNILSIIGFLMIGVGCAPIYPAIIRSTPYRFSRTMSQHVMGLEMAIAYCGNLIISPLYGLIVKTFNLYSALPVLVLVLAGMMCACHEVINMKLSIRDRNLSDEERKEYSVIS